jgi:hypothetical protein
MPHPARSKAAEELHDCMAVVVFPALDIHPAARGARSRYFLAVVVTSSAAAAAAVVVPVVGPPLRSRRVWVEAEEVARVAGEDTLGVALLT